MDLLALDPDNGAIVWGFQTMPHHGWDFDGVNAFVSFDLNKGGKTIKAGATADVNGFVGALDRTNGKFISATPFVEKIDWAKGIDENGRPICNKENQPGDPSKAQGRWEEGQVGFLGAEIPRRQEPDADRLQPRQQTVRRARQRLGHGHLERAGELRKGCRLARRRLLHQAGLG